MKSLFITLLLITMISACGNSNSSVKEEAQLILPDEIILIGQSTELLLHAPDNEITDIQWQQTSGETLIYYAANSKVIGFTPTVSGDYSFEVIFTADNEEKLLAIDFVVEQEKSRLTVRLGHAAVEGNGVSLVTYLPPNEDGRIIPISSLSWQQISGTNIEFTESNTTGKVAVFFDAPQVNKDEVITFSVSGEIDSDIFSDTIAILVENSTVEVGSGQNSPFSERVADVFLYNENSPAGQQLVDCVYSNAATYDKSCDFNQSQLIAHVTNNPSIDDIMDRVIVSHQWMGDQFKKFLETYDNQHHDFKNLLRATTAVVISYDIRPSFYHPYTGAIYLDPSDLWETPQQRDTINHAPDYRAGFGSDLQFEMPWRYVKNNEYANYYSPLSARLTRSLSASLYDFSALLYHELAHANDYFPSSNWYDINKSETFLSFVNQLFDDKGIQSDILQNQYPLDHLYASGGENELTQLAQVRFRGEEANNQQKAYSPNDIANMFATETAPQFYSYSSTREDYAILFDGFMMKTRYNVARDVAVSDQEYDQIFWGQRGRIGEASIKPRVAFVASRVLPEFTNLTLVIEQLNPPLLLDISKDWRGSLVIEEQIAIKSSQFAEQLLQQSAKKNPLLIPKDGVNHHEGKRKFIY